MNPLQSLNERREERTLTKLKLHPLASVRVYLPNGPHHTPPPPPFSFTFTTHIKIQILPNKLTTPFPQNILLRKWPSPPSPENPIHLQTFTFAPLFSSLSSSLYQFFSSSIPQPPPPYAPPKLKLGPVIFSWLNLHGTASHFLSATHHPLLSKLLSSPGSGLLVQPLVAWNAMLTPFTLL